jgi:hypothetical protein
MYLSKQWRESRIISILAIVALALLLALVARGAVAIDTVNFGDAPNHRGGFGAAFIPVFYIEAILVGFWGWLAAGIGTGKNLGEGGGSFLFTRPRRRAWFLWSDWGYVMAQIAAIIVLTNLMIGLLAAHILHLMHLPAAVQLTDGGDTVSLFVMMILVSVGVLLFAGLIYGITYFSTIVLKRAAGVMLGAGIIVSYLILQGLVGHYFPTTHLPNLTMSLFAFHHNGFSGFSGNLAVQIVVRAAVMMAFPIAAKLILDRSEI